MKETPTLKLRSATPADAGAIAALIRELGYDRHSADITAWMQKLNGGPSDRFIVAERGGEVIGFTSVHIMPFPHEDAWVARLTAIVVRSGSREEGVGGALLDVAEQFARAAGCVRLELTAHQRRTDAHAFYARQGYSPGDHAYFVKKL